MTLLTGKRLLITGVLTRESIAYAVAEAAQHHGAEVILTSFGRTRRLTERAARRLPVVPDVLELDVTDDGHHVALRETIEARWGGLDGVLHAVAYGPPDAIDGCVLTTPVASLRTTFETTAFSYQRLARTLGPLLARGPGLPEDRTGSASIVGLDFAAQPGWPGYDWMGIAKSTLREINRYLASELGPHGIRTNLVAAGPVRTVASGALPGWDRVQRSFPAYAPLGWDVDDTTPVADTVCFLLSSLSRAITGEILHVDGGIHALGGFSPIPWTRRAAAPLDGVPGGSPVVGPPAGWEPAEPVVR
jgi:meromycolic acid enoyl-[acyl-carrier-protein] reductase